MSVDRATSASPPKIAERRNKYTTNELVDKSGDEVDPVGGYTTAVEMADAQGE